MIEVTPEKEKEFQELLEFWRSCGGNVRWRHKSEYKLMKKYEPGSEDRVISKPVPAEGTE